MIINEKHHFTHVPIDLGYSPLEQVTTDAYRYYVTPEGKRYPSITTCISESKKEGLDAWRERVGEEEAKKISTKASGRGTLVHETIEDFIANKNIRKSNPLVQSNFLQVKPVIQENLSNIHIIESQLYSDLLGCAGTADCIGYWDGVCSIIDWKTSIKEKKPEFVEGYFMQGAFYSMALQEKTGIVAEQIVIVISVDELPQPQIFIQDRKPWAQKTIDVIKSYVETYPDRFDKGKII